MTAAYVGSDELLANPIDLMEQIASAHDWLFDRSSKSDLSLEVVGQWCDYRMFLSWHPEVSALLFVCAYDMRVPDSRWSAVAELLASINEKMLIGHFDLWSGDLLPVFRHSTLLRGMPGASVEQLEDLVHIARTECERYYPAFQFVIWGGKTPGEAITAAMLETMGEA
jgi:hypothetical protein